MFAWILKLFRKTEAFAKSTEAYEGVLGVAQELDMLVDHALTVISQEQVVAEQEIDALIAEMTRKKQGIVSGGKKAAHIQGVRAALSAAVGELKETFDDVSDAIEDFGASV